VSRCLYVGVTLLIMATSCGAGQLERGSFQTSDKVNLSYLETGKDYGGGKSPTIALIPGWSMPANIWRRQLEQFGRNYQTLAIDPRGQGDSDVPASGYSAERRATDLKEFLQPRANVLLIGWSLGAIESLP
jgi:non-heme chloroperoxidase